MTNRRRYPVGNPNFKEIREQGFLYVDKTAHVYRMTHADYKYVFLSRPRRFGKSLLTSTLQCYLEGRRELFHGLAIEALEREWTSYPVLHFDLSGGHRLDRDALRRMLLNEVEANERRMGITGTATDVSARLTNLIRQTCQLRGRQVVVLIDEYDAPMLDMVHDEAHFAGLRDVMVDFYSPLKPANSYLRFCFLTGITKFSQLSIFSALNNIKDISMMPEYAAVCGITREELCTQMLHDVEYLATRMDLTPEETLVRLLEHYDGYHFSWPSADILNPYSLMNAMSDGGIQSYWFESGTPTFLIEVLRKLKVKPMEIGPITRAKEDFDRPAERLTDDFAPLMYQSGYLTIKDMSAFSRMYTLDLPNKEVRIGLYNSLLPEYVKQPVTVRNMVGEMAEKIHCGDMDGALRQMQTVLGTLPYCTRARSEGHFQQLLALVFTLLGGFVDVEVRTPNGRVDIVLRTSTQLYLIELKMNRSAKAALEQIDLKSYPERFALCGLPLVKVGINFDKGKKNITDWTISPVAPH